MPRKATIHNIVTKLCSTGSEQGRKISRKGHVLTEEKLDDVSTQLEASSKKSSHLLAFQRGIENRTKLIWP
jgi:hypothetical protein